MFRTSTVLRSATVKISDGLRKPKPKVREETIAWRKEKKRLKSVNIYSGDFTGEKPPHQWMDPKRLRQLVQGYQRLRNMNRYNLKFDQKDILERKKITEEYGELHYREMLLEKYNSEKMKESWVKMQAEFEDLPYNLREEVKASFKSPAAREEPPEMHHFYVKYFEQIYRLYPSDYMDRIKIARRLRKIAENKLGDTD